MFVKGDEELDQLIQATIAGGGVVPHIHKALIDVNSTKNSKINNKSSSIHTTNKDDIKNEESSVVREDVKLECIR